MYREKYPFEFVKQEVEVDLTPREYVVLSLMAQGYSNQSIAEKLVVQPRTVERHIGGIFSTLPFDEGVDGKVIVDRRVIATLMYYRTPKFLSSQLAPSQPY